MKYPNLICTRCNNDAASDFDRAYDRLSDWFATQQNNYAMTEIDFREVFDKNYVGRIDALRRYRAKALGCRLLASGCRLPANLFPNPVSDVDVSILEPSRCRVQPFCHEKKFRCDTMERVLGNGPLYANISRSHLVLTGEREILNALWWENIGRFQITYWFDIDVNSALGAPIDDTATAYTIIHSDLCLPEMKSLMSDWISSRSRLRDLS